MTSFALPDQPVIHWRDLRDNGHSASCARMRALRLTRAGRLRPVGGRTGLYINLQQNSDTLWLDVLARLAPMAVVAGTFSLAEAGWLNRSSGPVPVVVPNNRRWPDVDGVDWWMRAPAEHAALLAESSPYHGIRLADPCQALADVLRHAPRLANTLSLQLPDSVSLDTIRRLAAASARLSGASAPMPRKSPRALA